MIFSIITIHKGSYRNLLKTSKSIDNQTIKPDRHIVVAKEIKNKKIINLKKKYRYFIIGQDKSLFNAMNIGLEKTWSDYVLFLNSGDDFYNRDSIKNIIQVIKNLNESRCIVMKTAVIFNKICFTPKTKYFNNINYLAHPSFIRPPQKNKLYFNEKKIYISDAIWMKKNSQKSKIFKVNKILSKHYVGGQSTIPSFKFMTEKFKFQSKLDGLLEIFKIILYNILTKNLYYRLIFSRKFEIKKI
jgi:hypothetical protein